MQGMNFIVEADKMRKYNCILGYIIYSVKYYVFSSHILSKNIPLCRQKKTDL